MIAKNAFFKTSEQRFLTDTTIQNILWDIQKRKSVKIGAASKFKTNTLLKYDLYRIFHLINLLTSIEEMMSDFMSLLNEEN